MEANVTDIDNPPWHEHLTFMSPLSERRADRLVRFLTAPACTRILDLGCGWGELLLRVLTATPSCSGMGIDLHSGNIDEARRRARERGLDGRVELQVGNAADHDAATVDALICLGASQIWGTGNEEPTGPLDYRRALTRLRSHLEPGGRLVYGEAIWTSEPTDAATASLTGRRDEYLPLDQVVELAVTCGFMPHAFHVADLDEWDDFECGFNAPLTAWLVYNGHDPRAHEIRQRAEKQRRGYLSGYRGVLGMVYMELFAL